MDIYSGGNDWWVPLAGIIAIAAIAAVVNLLTKLGTRYKSPDVDNSAVLFSYFSLGNDLLAADKHDLKDVPGGANSVTLITMPRKFNSAIESVAVDSGKAIQLIELPFRSRLHLLAISTGGDLDQLNPTIGTTAMSAVRLEGDFGNYFSLYIDKGQDFQLRYVLDPEAMEYVVDFCHKYHWEIIDDFMYIVAKSAPARDNIIAEFIAQIRPAIETKENTPVRPKQKQVQTWPKQSQFKCPVCHKNMREYKHWHECVSGHGQLVLGGNLKDADLKEQFISKGGKDSNLRLEKEHNITCPNCSKPMTPVQYGGSKTVIDSCTSCFYRWLDAGELSHILVGRPKH